jgi:protein-serine/threonine kinase
MNGISTPSSSGLTAAAQENFPISTVDGLPGRPGNSTIRWGGGLQPHPEVQELDDPPPEKSLPERPRHRPITPSLATLEKAVSARIYFENLYFPLLRQAPSREQRRLAMEKDMSEMQLSEVQKEVLRARWRQNETDYLREQRRKVDVSAFRKLKTIGHGLDHFFFILQADLTVCFHIQAPLVLSPL